MQIPKNDFRYHYVKTTVSVHVYEDRTLGIFYGHFCLGKYDEFGKLKDEEERSWDKVAA